MGLKLKTSISSKYLNATLKRRFVYAILGLLILLIANFFPEKHLQAIGWIVFLVSTAFLGYGLLPYRKLLRLQLQPNYLEITDDELHFVKSGLVVWHIQLHKIKHLTYIDTEKFYGIGIELQDGEKITLPYFSRHSFDTLKEVVETTSST